ncbi:MAG: 50S ribosomal protein L15 [Candidatus Kappaea frigidicola]|nr:50S ribosomal protein L15 [Candidatus Kappaea frigidicola]
MKLNELPSDKGSNKAKKRVGRGIGSKLGKTSGRGHKGQGSRSGSKSMKGFEGGQMPLIRKLPKRGFHNKFATAYQIVNVQDLNSFKENSTINQQVLKEAGLIRNVRDNLKVLGKGDLKKALVVEAHKFSKTAREKIEKVKGSIKEI